MNDSSPPLEALAALPVGGRARIARVDGGRGLARRLLGLGLRVGSEVAVLHHRGRGVVVASGDTRVALGGGIAGKLWVEPIFKPIGKPISDPVASSIATSVVTSMAQTPLSSPPLSDCQPDRQSAALSESVRS